MSAQSWLDPWGRQARELIKALTQISFAGCVADLWVPQVSDLNTGSPFNLVSEELRNRISCLGQFAPLTER